MKKISILLAVIFLLSTLNVYASGEFIGKNTLKIESGNLNEDINFQDMEETSENNILIYEETTDSEKLNIESSTVIVDNSEDITENVIRYMNDEEIYYAGCLRTPAEICDNIQKVPDLSSKVRSALPSKVDISQYFPEVGNQGSQNSCVGWATAYYLKTSYEQMERGWGVSSNSHIFSPSYVYNQINGGKDNGAYIYSALDLLKEQGVCTMANMPYSVNNYSTQPNTSQRAEASEYKIYDYAYISGNDIDKINKVKNELNQKNPVIIGVETYSDLRNLSSTNKVYDTIVGSSSGGHALCLVGYDDSLNAFKFVNSWGKYWGLSGYGYISYDLLVNSDITYDIYVLYDLINNQNMTLNKSKLNMDIGESFNLIANVTPATPGVQSFNWKTSNTSVATVNSSGEVLAKSKGNAIITVSERISGKSTTCNVTVYNKITVGSTETEINQLSNDSFRVYIRDVKYSDGSSLDNVWFPTWTENDEKDDLIWHEGTRISGTNDWVVTIKTSDHKNEVGKYITHIYTKRNGQEKYLSGIGYTIENKILYDKVVKENVPLYGNNYKIIIKNVRYSTGLPADKVWFPTWTKNNGQDDLEWYLGTKIKGTNDWEISINIANHNKEKGEYRTHIYAENENGRKYICQTDSEVIDAISNGITVKEISNTEIKITVKDVSYNDNTIPDKVMFPTWTESNGQDDLIWYEGSRVSGSNDWEVTIYKSDHNNESGKYITHVYARPYGTGREDRYLAGMGYNVN